MSEHVLYCGNNGEQPPERIPPALSGLHRFAVGAPSCFCGCYAVSRVRDERGNHVLVERVGARGPSDV